MWIRALVKIDAKRAKAMIAQAEKRAGVPYGLDIWPSHAEQGLTIIAGQSQSVMFALGDLAANGEDGLVLAGRI